MNNVYKEKYMIFLMFEHVFSLLYEDGSSLETRLRMLRVLATPLLCHLPFSIDREFTVKAAEPDPSMLGSAAHVKSIV